jgi:hypothetical protein
MFIVLTDAGCFRQNRQTDQAGDFWPPRFYRDAFPSYGLGPFWPCWASAIQTAAYAPAIPYEPP